MHKAGLRATIFALLPLIIGSVSISYGLEKPFALSASISHSQSLNNYQDGSVKKENSYKFVPSYKWSSLTSVLFLSYSQDLRYPENNDIGDIALKNIFHPHDFSRIQLVPALSFVVPQSKKSREDTNLEGAISARIDASIQKKLLIPGLSLGAGVSLGRSFHRYDTAVSGGSNTQYSSRQSVVAGYEYRSFSIGAEFHHINMWNYAGNMSDAFEHAEELSYALADHVSFSLGHTNAGSMLKANGIDSNFKLIDDNNSLAYAKVGIQY